MPDAKFERDFLGLNKGRPDTNLKPNEASFCKNVVFNRQRIEKRRGSMRVSPWVLPEAAMQFDGSTYAESPRIEDDAYRTLGFRRGSAHTMEMSLQFPSNTTTKTHQIAGRSTGAYGWGVQFLEDTNLFRYWEYQDTGTDIDFYGTYTNYAPGKPFHLAVVRDGAECRMYVNDGDNKGLIGLQGSLSATSVETCTTTSLPIAFGTGYAVGAASWGAEFRIQEFRTWDHVLATDTIDAYALRELPEHAHATNSCKFYYKFNEGSGNVAYDYGYISRLTTSTNLFAVTGLPSSPKWVGGMVHGGAGDYAARLDGKDDFFGAPTPNDELSAFRTGTENWSLQALVRPLDQVQDQAVFLQYGNATWTVGQDGFAFRLKNWVSGGSNYFVGQFCFMTETAEVVYSQAFTHSCSYRITMQRRASEVAMRVSPQDAADGSWETAGIFSTNLNPQFGAGAYLVGGAATPITGAQPTWGWAHCDLEELRLWSSLREEDMKQTYPNPHDPQLVAYYKFNDGSGSTVSDASGNRNLGYLLPEQEGPIWGGGIVEPREGGTVNGVFFYQKNTDLIDLNDVRNRGLLVCGANSIYRQEGGKWRELRGGRSKENLHTSAQLQEFMVIANGKDENLLYDGVALHKCGVDAPTSPPTHSLTSLDNGDTWDSITVSWAGALGQKTCVDSARTEQGYSFNDKRFVTFVGGSTGTVETKCEKYFKSRTFSKLSASHPYSTDSKYFQVWHHDWKTDSNYTVPYYVPIGGLAGGEFAAWAYVSSAPPPSQAYTWMTITGKILNDNAIAISPTYRGREIAIDTDHEFTQIQGHLSAVYLTSHFVWYNVQPERFYATSTYKIVSFDAGVEGDFYYRYTNYNKYTGIESLPSPPCDNVSNPTGDMVQVQVPYTTDTNVTDRYLYRTKRSGAKQSDFYFYLGKLDGTGTSTFNDTVVAGDEGRLISFYRDVPPKASIVKAFKGRVWYVSVENPHLLYFSEVGKPGEVDPFNYLIFGDGNDYITGLGISYDNLIVFKRRSIWVVSRAEVATGIRPYRLSDSVGCVGHHTIREVNGEILFLAEEGVYSLAGSQLRRVSSDKVQHYLERQDPSRRHLSVAGHLAADGIYRLNFSPGSQYASGVRSGVNSWYLDYHYQRSRDHVPFFESIWGYGEREVSAYGEFVSEDNTKYQAYGDYRGGVYVDNVLGGYSEGLGWYREPASAQAFYSVNGVQSAGAYTITVDAASLYSTGHGLKGLQVLLKSTDGTTETKTVYANTASQMVFTDPIGSDYPDGSQVLIAPIVAEYRSGWQDFGSSRSDKRSTALKLDYSYQTAGTMTVSVYGAKDGVSGHKREIEKALRMTGHVGDVEGRVRAKHLQVRFYHDHPGETFELFNWEWKVKPGRSEGDE